MTLSEKAQLVKEYVLSQVQKTLKQPRGYIRYPFIDPGSVYDGNVWDWDTYWSVYALFSMWDDLPWTLQRQVADCARGNVQNFFDHQMADGYIPMMVECRAGQTETFLTAARKEGFRTNMHKPFLASQIRLISDRLADDTWADCYADALRKYFACYENYYDTRTGLYIWEDDIMIGADNDPAVFGRPPRSTAGIFLNSFMVVELENAAIMFTRWGREEDAAYCRARREQLIAAIQNECWDERDQFFYSADVDVYTRQKAWFHQGLGVFWKTLPIRVRSWSGFIPLYAGVATKEQAASLAAWVMDEKTFFSPYGVCTLARNERMFDLSVTNNPSNWLGPIWLVSNYVVFRGLMDYGYQAEAQHLCEATLTLLANDLQQNGAMCEYYHPDTGKGIMNAGFLNWNMLAVAMYQECVASERMSQ